MPVSWRTGTASTTPSRQPRRPATAAQWRSRPQPCDLPGRMTAKRLRRLRQVKPERFTHTHESIKKRAREANIVIDNEQPVGADRGGRRQHPVQVLELASREVTGDGVRLQRGVARAGRAE